MSEAVRLDSNSPVVFTVTREIEERLGEFFRWTDRKVLLLKGPWGAGKSFFLRKYIRHHVVPDATLRKFPRWIAYTSLFGCSTIQSAEERIVSAFQPAKGWDTAEGRGWITLMAKAIRELSLSIYGIKLTPPLGSLLWWFVRKQEALLVLNDLERMEGLPLAQIMGLASSLTENSPVRLKVILVCNSERFQVDDQQNLATYREKVIHSELLYNPSPEEIVEQFFHQPRERAAMVECLRQSGQANIRIVIRVADALSQVSELFRKRGVELRGEDRECIVRTAAFYYLAGRSISAAYLEELASREYGKMMEAIVRPLTPTPDKTIPPDLTKELAKRLRVSTSNKLVPVVIGWIENGNVPEAELQPIVEWKKFEAASYRLRDREKDALGFLSDFRDVEPTTAISGLKSFLTLSHQEARLGTVMQFQGLLSELGETDTDWITKHVEAVISGFNEDQCRSYLRDLSTHSASAIVQARLQALGSGRNLKDVIWRMAGGSGWNNGDWEFLASKSADDYEAWLLAEDAENMRYMVRGLLQLGSLDGANPQGMAKRNLITALNRLRGRSIVQKLRLIDFPTELAAEETQGQ